MLNYIEQLRKKPEGERRRILFIIVFSLSVIIFSVWVSTFSSQLSFNPEEQVRETTPQSPFSILGSYMTQFTEDFRIGMEGIINTFRQ